MNSQTTLLTLLLSFSFYTCVRAQNCTPSAITTLEANGVRASLTTGGDLWWDGNDGGYVVTNEANSPNGKQTSMMFAGGFWMAGVDPGGGIKMAAQRYGRSAGNFDYQPGPLNADGTSAGDCTDWDRFFRATRSEVDAFQSAWQAGMLTADNLTANIAGWPATGNPYFAQTNGFELPNTSGDLAPFWDENRDGIYDPLEGDYPAFCGEEAVWWVFNDSRRHDESGSPSVLELEVQVMAYAVAAADDVLHRTTFYDYKIINRGQEDLFAAHAGIWVDPDIGCFLNDEVASDFERGIFYAYNQAGTPEDICGPSIVDSDSMRPATIFQFTDEALAAVPLGVEGRSFVATIDFPLGTPPPDFTDPFTPTQYYNVLRGKSTTGRSLTRRGLGNTPMGDTTRMAFDGGQMPNGDPWRICEAIPGATFDFKGVYALGPFDLPVGKSGSFTLAVSTIFDLEYPGDCPDDAPVLAAADSILAFYQNNCIRSVISDVREGQNDALTLAVFPNPTSDNLNFRLPAFASIVEVVIYDLAGREIGRFAGSGHEMEINFEQQRVRPGAYIYRLRSREGPVIAGRFVVR